MHGGLADLNPAEMHPAIIAQERVVIAWNVDDFRALPRGVQKLQQDVAMGRRPIPMRGEPPAVDNVADQINRVRAVMPQEIGEPVARQEREPR